MEWDWPGQHGGKGTGHNMLDSGFRAAVYGTQREWRNGAGGVVAPRGLGYGRWGGIRRDL